MWFDYHNSKKPLSSVLLCAGKSSRMGREKAFLPVEQETAITRIINTLSPLSELIVVVVSDNYEEIKEHLLSSYLELRNLHFAINKKAEKGMFTSIKKGLEDSLADKPVLLHMIDQPFLPDEIYDYLVDIIDDEHDVFQPSIKVNGKPRAGHPIIFSPKFRKVIISQPDEANLRDVMKQYNPERKFLEVEDQRVLQNINTMQDFEKSRKGR